MFGARKTLITVIAAMLLLAWGLSRFIAPVTFGLTEDNYQNRAEEPTPEALLKVVSGDVIPQKKPNIIVILADDLGYGDVGVYGNKTLDTPHIDQLATDGVRLSNFYSSAPICSPSRAGLLTGRYPVRSGIMQAMEAAGDTLSRVISRRAGMAVSNLASIDMRGGDNLVLGLPESEITIAEALKVAGYRTAAFGKWHLGDFTEWMQYHPSNHGFDHFVGFNMSNDDWPVAFYRDEEKVIDDIGIEQEPYTQLFTDSAIEFMEQSGDQPFFIYLSHKDPHQPFFPSEKFAGKSEGGPYGDAVAEFDGSVGDIVSALKRLKLDDNTLLIVTSDNGPWFEGSPGGLRGRKGQSYEGGFRVPMVAAWPGQIPAGLVSDLPAMNIDLLPTILNMAGVSLPADRVIDGVDIMPALTGQTQSAGDRPIYFFHDYDVEGLRVDQWKYIGSNSHYTWPNPLDKQDSFAGRVVSARNYTPPGSTLSIPTLGTWPLLYRLDRDKGEAYNVAKKYPRVAQRMGEQLAAWKKEFYANPRGWK
jgi:uncharacterized sulfatase